MLITSLWFQLPYREGDKSPLQDSFGIPIIELESAP